MLDFNSKFVFDLQSGFDFNRVIEGGSLDLCFVSVCVIEVYQAQRQHKESVCLIKELVSSKKLFVAD